jgi:NADPH:quinone reductase-like Zn-dependent oxidoreductase
VVRVHAAGINPVDWKIREGHLRFFRISCGFAG